MNYTRATTAALAAALLLGQAQSALAEPTFSDAVIIGRVKLQELPDAGDAYLAVTIPASDGMPANVKLWNLGTIQCGGVYDSFYHGGPGYFRVQNTGNYPAYVYISTGREQDLRGFDSLGVGSTDELAFHAEIAWHGYLELNPWLQRIDDVDWREFTYKLAVSTDVAALVPTWKPLSYLFCYDSESYDYETDQYVYANARYIDGRTVVLNNGVYLGPNRLSYRNLEQASAYLAYLPVGETQLFDLKFWAPHRRLDGGDNDDWLFFITIEASAVKFWDHDR